MNSDLEIIFSRTDLTPDTLDPFIHALVKEYPILRSLKSFEPIPIGFEDANVILNTTTGKYVLKIFANDLTLDNIHHHANVVAMAEKIGVPVPKLVLNRQGDSLTHLLSADCFITKFFEGQKMETVPPTLKDIKALTHAVALLNKLSFPLFISHDSWSNQHFLVEFKRDRDKVSHSTINTLNPVIQEYRHFHLKNPHYGVIHGDIQRKHVIKNTQGQYCLIDFGCARLDLLVYELSTFLAWFCLDETNWTQHQEIINTVLAIYTQTHSLNQSELHSLPILIRAAYAAYLFRTDVLLSEGDDSQEVKDWHHLAQTMLNLSQELKNIEK